MGVTGAGGYQGRVAAWLEGAKPDDPTDLRERVTRVAEEAAELLQALGQTRAEARSMVDHVHDKPPGDPAQEMGGLLVTTYMLAEVAGLDAMACAEAELARISTPEVSRRIATRRALRHGGGTGGDHPPDFVPALGG